jgi:hypothetical protein
VLGRSNKGVSFIICFFSSYCCWLSVLTITNLNIFSFFIGTMESCCRGFVSWQQAVFKKPLHTYDFRKKVISAMKLRYLKVTGHRTHSGDPLTDNEDISAVDHLAVKLYQEIQLAIDKD